MAPTSALIPTRSYFSLAVQPTPEILAEIAEHEAHKAAKKAARAAKKQRAAENEAVEVEAGPDWMAIISRVPLVYGSPR